jgi:hypothetical protein
MVGSRTGGSSSDGAIVERLKELNVTSGVIVQMAKAGQLLGVRCEMPQCYYHKGRSAFDVKTHPPTNWQLSADHYPILKHAGGKLTLDNVRLSHILCNRQDYGWRMRIKGMLGKGMALEAIADKLNNKGIPPAHGTNRWTAAMVRKAYVS